jgi:hypothetical protein
MQFVPGGGGGGSADFKNARRVASITALPAYARVGNVITANAVGALPAIDGIALLVTESFLLRTGAALEDNGLWDVTVVGDGATAFVLTRSADADTDAEVTSGMRVPILDGSFAGQTFVLVTADPIVLNTTGLIFALDTGSSLWKEPRLTATDTALPAYARVNNTITASANGALPAIAGVSLAIGESFVFRNGAALADNGLWDVAVLGDGGTPFQLTRSADASTSPQMASGMRVPITEGTYAGQTVYLSTQGTVALNTTPLTFSLDALPATRPAVRTVTEVALPAYTRTDNAIVANANGALPSISTVALAVGDGFLFRNGVSATDNGLWAVTDLGGGGTPYRLIRAPDANASAQVSSGMRVAIPEGNYAGRTFYLATSNPIDLNTTGLTWSVDAPGSTFKGARRTASAAVLPAYTRVGNVITANAVGALPSIGGVALAAGESFLFRHGAAAVDNGLWDVTILGDGGTAFQLTRSPDANVSSQMLSGLRVPISEGTFIGQAFTLSTADPITLNVTGLTFDIAAGVPPGMFTSIPVATGAYANNETIAGVVATPGWNVITEFDLDTLPSQGAILDGIVLVSGVALTGRLRLYDVTGAAAVAGSTLSTVSLTGERIASADLTAVLVAGRRYQIQAECTGGSAPTDWAVVRYATVIPSP